MNRKFYLVFLFLFGLISSSFAQEVQLSASVSSSTIALNETAQLTLTVTGVKDNIDPINLPSIDGFETQYLGPSTSISIVNGSYSSERSFLYSLFPKKTGHFKIPSISAQIAGQNLSTAPIDVEVVGSPSSKPQEDTSPSAPTAESLKDKIHLTMELPQADFFVNEKIPLVIKFYVRDIPVRDLQLPKVSSDDFMVSDFLQPKQYTAVISGAEYNVVEFKAFIYPKHSGSLVLSPARIEANILYKNSERNAARTVFGDSFFSNFLDTYSARPISVESGALTLNVLDLPTDIPLGYSNAVGQFDFKASVSPLEVKEGDPLTLRMSIAGEGNLKSARLPKFEDSRFKTYDPQIKDDGDGKNIEQVIIPTSDKITEVPAFHFIYFDPKAKEFKTITQGPFVVKVSHVNADDGFKAVGFNEIHADGGEVKANEVKNTITTNNVWTHLKAHARALLRSWVFWLVVAVIMFNAILWILWKYFSNRIRTDQGFARRISADKNAKETLDAAKKALSQELVKDFYGLLSKLLNNFIVDKMGGHLDVPVIDILKQRNISQEIITQYKTILEKGDLVRFAGKNIPVDEMTGDLKITVAILSALRKALR